MRHLSRLLAALGAVRTWAAALSMATVATLVLSASAEAVVTSVPTESGPAVVGLQPRNGTNLFTEGALPKTFSNPEGHPVVPNSNVYAIYWDPSRYEYHGDWQGLIDNFLAGIGSASGQFANVLTVDEQYTDKANEGAAHTLNFHGAYTDTEAYPVLGNCVDPHPMSLANRIACLTDAQLHRGLETFIEAHHLPKGMSTVYYLLTPPGVTVCVDHGGPTGHCSDSAEGSPESYENSFCSYHSAISPTDPVSGDANTILYGVIPWTAGTFPDYQFAPEPLTVAWDCQDGGFDPAGHVVEEREKAHERSVAEQEAFNKMSLEEKRVVEETEAREGPHTQEPNQPITAPGPDGYYDTGLADLIINQIAVEQQNIVTDPLLDGWQDAQSNEATDECRNFFAPAQGSSTALEKTDAGTLFNQSFGATNYYLNTAFNLASQKLAYPAVPCIPGIRQDPQFTAPNVANAGELVGFDGMESDITLDAGTRYTKLVEEEANYPLFTWDYGDGTPTVSGYAPGGPTINSSGFNCDFPWHSPCAASTFHAYQYGGTYQVTLTAIDVGGNTVSVMHEITIDGPPPPPPPAPPAPPAPLPEVNGSPGIAGAPGSGKTGSGPGGGSPVFPGPVAQAVASSRSLPQALRSGLVVKYSVNEQVAGHFEVLLNSQTARRLGIRGPVATGLPAGTPQSLVIGQAILVTTKGGHSTVRIKFSKRTAQHLHHVARVSLMLRLVVRNASAQNPQSTTVITTFVLHR